MSAQEPIQARKPDDRDKQLVALFQEIEKGQLTFLDEAGKRIIELSTALLGVLFTVIALGKDFPPPYLKDNPLARLLAVLVVIANLAAILLAMRAVQPRSYKLFRENLTGMREELDKIITHKSGALRLAGITFWIGAALLAGLIATIVLSG